MQEISGQALAVKILERLKKKGERPHGIFAAVLVGDDPASESFVRRKASTAHALGIDFQISRFPATCLEKDLYDAIDALAARRDVKGIMIQLPLPPQIDVQALLDRIPKEKDVDVLGSAASGAFATGARSVLPPSVGVLKEIIDEYGLSVENGPVAVVGLGRLIGRPIAIWLSLRARTMHLIDKGGEYEHIKSSDIVVLGTGAGSVIDVSMVKEGSFVIDFGYAFHEANGVARLCGDFMPEGAEEKNIRYTPTPGGTGPVLVAKLFENFYTLNE